MERLGKGRDRSVCTPELLQNAASGGVRERAERGIEVGFGNTEPFGSVYNMVRRHAMLRLSAPCVTAHAPELTINGAAFRNSS